MKNGKNISAQPKNASCLGERIASKCPLALSWLNALLNLNPKHLGDLTNITREPSRRIELNVGLTYSTTPEQMRQAMDILRNLPSSVTGIEEKVKVYFTSFGDFSLNITCWYYIKTVSDLFETQSAVNLQVLGEFNAHGLDFAFPTQTLYVNK